MWQLHKALANLSRLGVEEGITLTDLGERVGPSDSSSCLIERDRTTPSISALTSISKALIVGLRHFFETEGELAITTGGEPRAVI